MVRFGHNRTMQNRATFTILLAGLLFGIAGPIVADSLIDPQIEKKIDALMIKMTLVGRSVSLISTALSLISPVRHPSRVEIGCATSKFAPGAPGRYSM